MAKYTHGHARAVVNHHAARTVANSAAFVESRLTPGATVLDVGCGPGSITHEIAALVAPGRVVGIDPVADIVERARETTDASPNLTFEVGSVHDLAERDETFDVVYAHQVLQHLTDPVAALRDMRSVCAPGGVVAVRDADYAAMAWAPAHPHLDRWMELYHEVTARNGAEADAGRFLLGWSLEAGLREPIVTTSTWTYADDDGRRWWGDGWAQRAVASGFADQAIEYELSDAEELRAISEAWSWWAEQPDGYFVITHTEVIAQP